MKEIKLPNRAKRRQLASDKTSHKNSKAGNKQIIGTKVIHHLPKKCYGIRKVFSAPEKILLELVEKRGWYGENISKSNAQSIKKNLKEGTITKDRVFSTLTILGYKNTNAENWVKI